jgi:deoxyhypusine synthase
MTSEIETGRPQGAAAAVLAPSAPVPEDAIPVIGPDFEKELSLASFLNSYNTIGFQASSFGKAIDIVNQMVSIFSS